MSYKIGDKVWISGDNHVYEELELGTVFDVTAGGVVFVVFTLPKEEK
jgi:hypothetical protein